MDRIYELRGGDSPEVVEFTSSEVVDRRIFELRDGGSRRPGWQTAGKLTFTEAEKVFGTVKVN